LTRRENERKKKKERKKEAEKEEAVLKIISQSDTLLTRRGGRKEVRLSLVGAEQQQYL